MRSRKHHHLSSPGLLTTYLTLRSLHLLEPSSASYLILETTSPARFVTNSTSKRTRGRTIMFAGETFQLFTTRILNKYAAMIKPFIDITILSPASISLQTLFTRFIQFCLIEMGSTCILKSHSWNKLNQQSHSEHHIYVCNQLLLLCLCVTRIITDSQNNYFKSQISEETINVQSQNIHANAINEC